MCRSGSAAPRSGREASEGPRRHHGEGQLPYGADGGDYEATSKGELEGVAKAKQIDKVNGSVKKLGQQVTGIKKDVEAANHRGDKVQTDMSDISQEPEKHKAMRAPRLNMGGSTSSAPSPSIDMDLSHHSLARMGPIRSPRGEEADARRGIAAAEAGGQAHERVHALEVPAACPLHAQPLDQHGGAPRAQHHGEALVRRH